MREFKLYTDGSCLKNPGGAGGIGILLIEGTKEVLSYSRGFLSTTNNRMELLACIIMLEKFEKVKEKCKITVYSDSKYLVDAIEAKWINGWIKKGFKKVKNVDLWKRLLKVLYIHEINFIWVKGHSENIFNNRCNDLAYSAAKGNNLMEDIGYEK